MSRLARLDLPPVWLALFLVLAWGIAQAHAPLGDRLAEAGWAAGWALVALALGIVGWAALAFRRAGTTIMPHEAPSALVEGGPYRWSRNPIYLADLMILAGAALILGAPLALVLLLPFRQVLLRRFILPEEARLEQALGEVYRTYKARVRRWA